MNAKVGMKITAEFHVPSPFYNRGEQNPEKYNYGRIEYDLLHHVSAAVHAIGSSPGNTQALVQEHVRCARELLDALENLASMFPGSFP